MEAEHILKAGAILDAADLRVEGYRRVCQAHFLIDFKERRFGDIEPDEALALVKKNFGGLRPDEHFKPIDFQRDNRLSASMAITSRS